VHGANEKWFEADSGNDVGVKNWNVGERMFVLFLAMHNAVVCAFTTGATKQKESDNRIFGVGLDEFRKFQANTCGSQLYLSFPRNFR
jgi:hypothetical protein